MEDVVPQHGGSSSSTGGGGGGGGGVAPAENSEVVALKGKIKAYEDKLKELEAEIKSLDDEWRAEGGKDPFSKAGRLKDKKEERKHDETERDKLLARLDRLYALGECLSLPPRLSPKSSHHHTY
jgi:hypothetical protein